MKVSLIVPTLGERKSEIIRLFDSLIRQTYKNFEVIVVVQDNFDCMQLVCEVYKSKGLGIKFIKSYKKGLSKARNLGINFAEGKIIVLSDDDCWYPDYALEYINNIFDSNRNIIVSLSQIYDFEKGVLYKKYSPTSYLIPNKLHLMSKSSIEIAFIKDKVPSCYFDERFGLGAKYICGEEIDFLLQNYEKSRILYTPKITVYHPNKSVYNNSKRIVAKGALYRKHFNFILCICVLLRDLFIKHENNFMNFYKGYSEFR